MNLRPTTEEEKFYYCKEMIPDIAGTYSGTLACFGGGKTMWEDYDRFKEIAGDCKYDKMATNIAGLFVDNIQHLYSLHFKQIALIRKFRDVEYAEAYKKDRPICHAGKEWEGVDCVWYPAGWASTSGFTMLVVGWLLGYRKFVLIGIPMDGSGYFYKPSINKTFEDDQRYKEICYIKDKFRNNIRSMSGRTRDIMGEPTIDWIKENDYASTK